MNRRISRVAAYAALTVTATLALSACSGGGNPGPGASGKDQGTPVKDATFTYAMPADPGTLDPFKTAVGSARAIDRFVYARLVERQNDGSIHSGLAAKWESDTTKATFTLREGLTCEDGSELKATDVAANISFIGDPANAVPMLGIQVMPGTKAVGDDSARTVTVTSGRPDAFLLENVGSVSIVCGNAIKDTAGLAKGKGATGAYTVTDIVPNSQYTLTRRKDVKWAPDNWEKTAEFMPAKVVVKIVPNESTAVNLMSSGEINLAAVIGPETARAEKVATFKQELVAPAGQLSFNEDPARITSDKAVRLALTQALDLKQLREIATAKKGTAPKSLVTIAPLVCSYDSVSGNVPETDVKAAAAGLDTAGWKLGSDGVREKDGKKLKLKLVYSSTVGETGTAAMELLVDELKKVGADVTLQSLDGNGVNATYLGSRDWDLSGIAPGVSLPSMLVPFHSGPIPPNGVNAASLKNAEHDAAVAKASAQAGAKGCDDWKAAEVALLKNVDIVPFADLSLNQYAKNASFVVNDNFDPWSIRIYKK